MNTCFVLGGEETHVQFNCSINHVDPADVALRWQGDNSDSTQSLTSNELIDNAEKYDIQGEYNLLVLNVTSADAYDYICLNSVTGTRGISKRVKLLILGNLFGYACVYELVRP